MNRPVKELMTKKYVKISEEDTLSEIVLRIAEDKETMLACVVDKNDTLKGIITPREILKTVELREYGAVSHMSFSSSGVLHILNSNYAKDIMSTPVSVKPDDEVRTAIDLMLDKWFYEVPIVDKDGKILGEINFFSITGSAAEYLKP